MRTHRLIGRIVAGVILAVWGTAVLGGCEMPTQDDDEREPEPRPPTLTRCDAAAEWYIGKPIEIRAGRDMNPPQIPDPSRDDGFRTDWSKLEAVVSKYAGRAFTLSLFREIQQDLYATGLYQEGDEKWGIETVAYPGTVRRTSDPRHGAQAGGCFGVELHMDGDRSLPQEIQERPLRLVE